MRALIPDEMPGSLQYDNGVNADVVLRPLVAQMLSLEWVAQSPHTLIAQRFAEVTLLHYVQQLHQELADRDLCTTRVKQKVSGRSRTQRYADANCRISGYRHSMANHGYEPLESIQSDLAGRDIEQHV